MAIDIIRDLYFGRLYPCEKIVLTSLEYHKADDLVDEARQALVDGLTSAQVDQLETLENLQGRVDSLYSYACFRHGLCMGLALMSGVAEELG